MNPRRRSHCISVVPQPHPSTLHKLSVVLVADDDEYSSDCIVDAVKRRYSVRRAWSGDEALAELRRDPRPALVLLDVMLPGLDGYDLLRLIKADPDTASIPVIAVGTGSMLKVNEALVWELGAADYIQKYVSGVLIDAEDLMTKLQRQLG